MFVESAGLPEVIAGDDPADAAGLTQILAQTGQSLLGMHIDLAREPSPDRRDRPRCDGRQPPPLRRSARAPSRGRSSASIRPRSSPRPSATCATPSPSSRREDLAFESYHMGIGNLEHVLGDYDGGRPVPYAQLYFDTSPRPPQPPPMTCSPASATTRRCTTGACSRRRRSCTCTGPTVTRSGCWRRCRGSRARTRRCCTRPEGRRRSRARARSPPPTRNGRWCRCPATLTRSAWRSNPRIGSQASRVGATPSLYRGLRPVALRVAGRARGVGPLAVGRGRAAAARQRGQRPALPAAGR